MIVRDPRATWRYVPESDRELPPEKQTVFTLRHLTLADEHALFDGYVLDGGRAVRRGRGTDSLAILRKHLAGWENLRRPDGTLVEFVKGPDGGPRDELLYLLPPAVRIELATAVEHEVVFDPSELGKSEPQPT